MLTEKHKISISKGMMGHRMSKETKEKIAIQLRGRKASEGKIQKLKDLMQRKIVCAELFKKHLYDSGGCGQKCYDIWKIKISKRVFNRKCPACDYTISDKMINDNIQKVVRTEEVARVTNEELEMEKRAIEIAMQESLLLGVRK